MKKKNTCLIRVITLMITVTLIGAGTGFAATLTWDGGGDDANWSAGTNWVGDPGTGPDSGDTIVFDANSTADRNTVCDIALTGITIIVSGDPGGLCSVEATAALTIAGITQGSTAQHLTLSRSGLGSLALSAAAVFEATTQWLTFNGPLNNGDFLLTLQGAGIIVFTGGISGDGGLTLNMSGNQAVTINTAPCTYTGDTTITKGFFTTAAANVLPDNSDISIANDADARLVLSGGAETIGSLSGGGAAGGNVALGGATVITQTVDGTYAGVISGAYILEKAGANKLTLSGTNTYTGSTTVSAGTLNIQNDQGTGTTAGGVTVYAGASLQLEGGITVDEFLWLYGGGSIELVSVDGNNTWAGVCSLATAAVDIQALAGSLTFGSTILGQNVTFDCNTGDINANGAVGYVDITVTKTGSGTLNLNAANSFGGALIISGGTCALNHVDAFGTGAGGISMANGTTLRLGVAINDTNWDPAITLTGSATIESDAADSNIDQLIDIDTNTLTVIGDENLTISGAIGTAGDTGGLTLNMTDVSDILIVSGANTYEGATTVSAGTLNVQHDTGTGDTAVGVFVTAGASLQLQGDVTVGAEALTLNGDGGAVVELESVSGDNTWGGVITLETDAVDIKSTNALGVLTLTGTITGQNVTFDGAGQISAGGVISGGITVTQSGTGALHLGGDNTYTGALSVGTGGLVTLQHINAFGTGAGTLSIGDGGQLVLLTAINDIDWDQAINLAGAATIWSEEAGCEIDKNINNAAGLLTIRGDESLTISGIIGPGSGGLTVDMDLVSDVVIVSGANTYEGATTVSAGTLNVRHDTGTGAITGGVTVAATNGRLQLEGGVTVGAEALTLNGDGGAVVELESVSGFNTWGGPITLETDAVDIKSTNAPGLTLTGTISGQNVTFDGAGVNDVLGVISGGITVTQSGAGILALSGDNTYTGSLSVGAGGTVVLNHANAFGTGAGTLSIGDGGSLWLSAAINATDWDQALNLAGAATIICHTVSEIDKNITNAAGLLTITGSSTLTISGVIGPGAGGLTVDMTEVSNVVTLSGTNTYTGQTMLNAGTLLVNAVQGDANDADLTVSNGATLGGTGTVKSDVYVQDGGIIKPGGSVGTLTVAAGTGSNGNVTFQGASRLVVDIQNATKDLLAVGGILTLPAGTATLELEAGYNWSAGSDPYQVVTITGVYDDSGGKVFSDANLPANWSIISTTDTDIKLTYSGVAVVPTLNEWGIIVAFLLLAGAGVMLMRKQRAGNTA